jgi:hypothetical protein
VEPAAADTQMPAAPAEEPAAPAEEPAAPAEEPAADAETVAAAAAYKEPAERNVPVNPTDIVSTCEFCGTDSWQVLVSADHQYITQFRCTACRATCAVSWYRVD